MPDRDYDEIRLTPEERIVKLKCEMVDRTMFNIMRVASEFEYADDTHEFVEMSMEKLKEIVAAI